MIPPSQPGTQGQANLNPNSNPMAGAQQAPAGHPAAAAQRTNMYRPEMMRNLPILNEEEKTKYEKGLRSLWTAMEAHPEESPQHQESKKKIQEFTKMLMGKLQARRVQMQQQQQQQQQQQRQQNQQQLSQTQQQQGQPGSQQKQTAPSQAATSQTLQAAPTDSTPASAPASQVGGADAASQRPNAPQGSTGEQNAPGAVPNAPAAAGQGMQQPQQQQQQPSQIPEHILNHVRSMSFHPPPQVIEKGAEAAAKWPNDMRQRYVRSLMQMEHMSNQIRKLNNLIKDRQDKGNPISADEMKQIQIRKDHSQKMFHEAQQFVQNLRKTQEMVKNNAQNGPAANRPPQQNNAAGQAAGNAAGGPQPGVAGGAPASIPGAEGGKGQQMAGGARAGPGATGQQQQQQQPGAASQGAGAAQAAPMSASTSQGQQPQQPHQPPPVNTAVASVAGAPGQNPSAGTPMQQQNSARVATPQSALPAGSQALSHSAAVSRANQRVNSQPSSGVPQPATGTPSSSAGAMVNNSQQGHGPAHQGQPNQQAQPLQSKLPIPKQLHEKATTVPQAVNMVGGAGAGRPTYTGGGGTAGGVMGQVAVQKVPVYSHEAEGDHVLSKKKLDELVRQVCGGTAEGQEGNLLSPEVEENVLNMADTFIDDVLHAACRCAKERGSKVLEIRDLQLVLERTYNIRVPGYSSDELRTVRKVQPSPAWITKMSAIQAAKVTSGKTE